MTVPEIVRERLGDEEIRRRIALGGDDELLTTSTRILIYRAEGLLSGESVEDYPHEAERVAVSQGRRKSSILLDHGIEGESEFSVPSSRLDETLKLVLGGVFAAADVTEPDEDIADLYRLGELTVVITESRVVKHIGDAVWDEEFEEYAFERVTGLDIEAGDMSSQIIIEVDGRPQRIKTPTDVAREIREHIEQALLSYHGVASYTEFARQIAEDEDEDENEDEAEAASETAEATAATSAETGATQTSTESDGAADGVDDADEDDESELVFAGERTADVEPVTAEQSGESGDVAGEIAELRQAVERQNDLLERHEQTIEELIDELRRGR